MTRSPTLISPALTGLLLTFLTMRSAYFSSFSRRRFRFLSKRLFRSPMLSSLESSRSSFCTSDAVSLASRSISLASSLASAMIFSFFFSRAASCLSSSSCFFFMAMLMATASSRSASAFFLSASMAPMTSSNSMSPRSMSWAARSMRLPESPSFFEISKALDFPGMPMVSR